MTMELIRLANQNKFGEIVELIEQIPESERSFEIIGWYVRSLNNTGQLRRAVDVSLQYKEAGENDPFWHYRLGYAYVNLSRNDEAKALLLRGKELAEGNSQLTEWIDELLERAEKEAEDEKESSIRKLPTDDAEVSTSNYVFTSKYKNSISVVFNIERDNIIAIGEKMNEINSEAYMNGYNWEAFFNYYLPKYAPDVTEGMDTDPEAGTYVAYYEFTPENEARAEKFVSIITELIENEEKLYRIVREEGGNIEWD
jgi:hypothetical protein